MRYSYITIVLLLTLSSYAADAAKKNYVRGVQKVTFRTGPGTDSKIVKMMDADSPVTIIDTDDEWSEVEDKKGKTGYILTRFLTTDIPFSLKYKWLQRKQKKIIEENKTLKEKNSNLEKTIKETSFELKDNLEKLTISNSSFDKLKEDSTDFLKLQTNNKRVNILLDEQILKINGLEKKMSKQYIYWFLAGAGVLFLGWILGVAFKRKSSGSGGLTF